MVQYIPQGPFFIVSQLNGRVIDVHSASTKDGAQIITWKKKDSDNENQLWEYRHGAFVNVRSGKVLDIKGGKVKSDTEIIQYAQKSEDRGNQTWTIDHDGYIHAVDNPDLVLDIRGEKDEDGAEIILYEKRLGNVASNQRWNLAPLHPL